MFQTVLQPEGGGRITINSDPSHYHSLTSDHSRPPNEFDREPDQSLMNCCHNNRCGQRIRRARISDDFVKDQLTAVGRSASVIFRNLLLCVSSVPLCLCG